MNKAFIILVISLLAVSIYSENLHPNFNITKDELINILDTQIPEIKINILKRPVTFLNQLETILYDYTPDLTLVDKENRLGSDFIPVNMVNLSDYDLSTRYATMMFCDYAVEDFVKMSNSAKEEGIEIFIASTYRSYEFQDQIFTNMKNYHGEEKAATIVAYPGASQHQLGTGVDFGSIKPSYAFTDAGIWLKENAWKYGFSISYPNGMEDVTTYMWEPWHYRYIGKQATKIQRKYFMDVQHYLLEFLHNYKEFFLKNHIQQD